jgi:hypothetical protein
VSSLEEAGSQVEVASSKTAAACGMSGVSVGDERGSPAHHSKDGLGTEPEPEDLWRARTHRKVCALNRALHGCQRVRVRARARVCVCVLVCVCACVCAPRNIHRQNFLDYNTTGQFPTIGWKGSFERRIFAKCREYSQ